jgi:hypothetical protein
MDFSTDSSYISAIGSKAYIATVSPAFFTHYAPWSWNKVRLDSNHSNDISPTLCQPLIFGSS